MHRTLTPISSAAEYVEMMHDVCVVDDRLYGNNVSLLSFSHIQWQEHSPVIGLCYRDTGHWDTVTTGIHICNQVLKYCQIYNLNFV